jgi:hypothetical protein
MFIFGFTQDKHGILQGTVFFSDVTTPSYWAGAVYMKYRLPDEGGDGGSISTWWRIFG